jgi:hypothetical protein
VPFGTRSVYVISLGVKIGTNAPTLGTSALSVASVGVAASLLGVASLSGLASPFGIAVLVLAFESALLLQLATPRAHTIIATMQIANRFMVFSVSGERITALHASARWPSVTRPRDRSRDAEQE